MCGFDRVSPLVGLGVRAFTVGQEAKKVFVSIRMKTQHERDDNCALIEENYKIRSANKAMREALKNVICSTCDEEKLRIENAQLKEELVRVSSIAAGYTGKSLSHLLPGSSSTLPNVSTPCWSHV
ncbi:homeobox protein, putative [Medicago truncatula]|uniref:Homeobox protein, putative n=1 Tax=Medicago truncatula TaxID=3880 RepID=A0A072U7Y8_MEDTR|nr:homeobox protein, putative [Medicago truncatula]